MIHHKEQPRVAIIMSLKLKNDTKIYSKNFIITILDTNTKLVLIRIYNFLSER